VTEPFPPGSTDELRRVDPEKLDVDGVPMVVIGTVLWGIALVLTIVFRHTLSDHHHGWWVWTCLAGFTLGLIGIPYMRRFQRRS
jgi:Protein of unknown function (DUF2530)